MIGVQVSIKLPANGWMPRAHQNRLWDYLRATPRDARAMAIWHRRAGKDEIALHNAAISMHERPGNFWHCLPQYQQCRRAIWTAVNPHTGRRRIDEAFPADMRATVNDHEMFIRFHSGATWQLIGSDNYDTAVGASPAGIVFSEWALSNPSAWGYFRPMLQENHGYALFITTPRGRNHAHDMFQYAEQHPEQWFAERLTVNDTQALTAAEQAAALDEYQNLYGEDVGTAQFNQEYHCDWNAAILGAFYALEMAAVRNENRIVEVEADYARPVHHAWDLGMRDDTAIWFWQSHPSGQILLLDFYAASGVGVEHYNDVIRHRHEQHGWTLGTDFVPHDAAVKEWGSGRTRVETMQQFQLKPQLVTNASLNDGINAARRTLPFAVFHPRCQSGIDALEQYRREWNDETKAFKANAVHDWTSHPADAFRYLALAWRPPPLRQPKVVEPAAGYSGRGWIIPPPLERRRGMVL